MKEIKDQNTCVRVFRDEKQIARCKERIHAMNETLSDTAQVLALAGNEVRLKTLLLLQEEQRLCVCDLSEILEMKVPAVSQHLRKLKDGKLLVKEREGTTIYYSINPEFQPVINSIFSPSLAFSFV